MTTKSLANAYSETIGTIFTRDPKPLEVEILVVEVGESTEYNEMYHISFDGSISDHRQFAVIARCLNAGPVTGSAWRGAS